MFISMVACLNGYELWQQTNEIKLEEHHSQGDIPVLEISQQGYSGNYAQNNKIMIVCINQVQQLIIAVVSVVKSYIHGMELAKPLKTG